MTANQLKRKYPKLWREMIKQVHGDTLMLLEHHLSDAKLIRKLAKIIAHNAAFYACEAYHFDQI